MPSKSNKPRLARSAGFTLIEILVVVVIIAVVAATAVLAVSVTGRDRELEKESERMYALLNYVREQAELSTREFGLLCEENRYRFVRYDATKNEWIAIETDAALLDRGLPEGLSFSLTVEARPVVLHRPPDSKDLTPQVMLFSNGDMTPFELTLQRESEARSITLASTDDGKLEARPMEERTT